MKKLLVLLALLAAISPGVVGGTGFHGSELGSAVEQLARASGERVIFLTRPKRKVTATLAGTDFEEDLHQLLSGTPYKFTKQNDYYLIGKFKPGSLEFAAHSESLLYRPHYLPADELARSLTLPNIRVKVLDGAERLLLQGLPEDLERARRELERLDSEDNPYQVRYELTLIDLTERRRSEFDVSTANITTDSTGPVEFIASGEAVELLSMGPLELLEVKARRSSEKTRSVARPSLVTLLGRTGSFSFSRESIYSGNWIDGMEKAGIEASITPIRKSRPAKEIKTDIELSVSGKSELSTTTWLEPAEKTLLGLLNFNSNVSKNNSRSRYNNLERTFALYIEANPVGTLPVEAVGEKESGIEDPFSPSISMDGLGQLLFPERERALTSVEGELQFMSDGHLDLSLEETETGAGIGLGAGGTNCYFNLSLDFPINEALNLEGRYLSQSSELSVAALGLADEFEFSSNMELGFTYYPLVFRTDESGWGEQEFRAGLSYSSDMVVADFRYSTGLEPDRVRVEIGWRLPTSFYLVGSAVGDTEGFYEYLLGLRVRF